MDIQFITHGLWMLLFLVIWHVYYIDYR